MRMIFWPGCRVPGAGCRVPGALLRVSGGMAAGTLRCIRAGAGPSVRACGRVTGWTPIGLVPCGGRWTVTFPGRVCPAPSAAAACAGVFVGRAGELAVLEAVAVAVRCDQPKVVLVEGEGGAGKSSLLTYFAAGLAGVTVLRASGDEAELLLPYGIVGQLVASARGAGGSPAGLWLRS